MIELKARREYDVSHGLHGNFRIRVITVLDLEVFGIITQGVCQWGVRHKKRVGDSLFLLLSDPWVTFTLVEKGGG